MYNLKQKVNNKEALLNILEVTTFFYLACRIPLYCFVLYFSLGSRGR